MIEDFEDRWRTVIAEGAAATREVDATSSLRMICGVDGLGRPLFFIISHNKPGLPHLAGAVGVERRHRELDATWTLSFALNVPALTDVFITLVVDLAARCAKAKTEVAAMETLLDTVEQWQLLLQERFDRLSEDRLRGLMAELWFGFRSGHHGQPLGEAVRAWSGPYGGEQDYVFPPPGLRYEVKAVRPNREGVEVSSERQLDGEPIELAAVTIDRSADPTSWSLPALVAAIRKALPEPETRVEFNRAFVELRVNLDDAWYADQSFDFHRLRTFAVKPEFPAIRRSELPEALSRTKYRLDLSYVDDFLLTDIDVTDRQGVAP